MLTLGTYLTVRFANVEVPGVLGRDDDGVYTLTDDGGATHRLVSDARAVERAIVRTAAELAADAARLAECQRRIELSKLTAGLTHCHFSDLASCCERSEWKNNTLWKRRMIRLGMLGLVRRDTANPYFYVATDLGREVIEMRRRPAMVAA